MCVRMHWDVSVCVVCELVGVRVHNCACGAVSVCGHVHGKVQAPMCTWVCPCDRVYTNVCVHAPV